MNNITQVIIQRANLEDISHLEWRYIDGTNEDYAISNDGKVISFKRKPALLSPAHNAKGYIQYGLYTEGIRRQPLAHRLVAEAFIPRDREEADHVNHIDGNVQNNHYSNLEWVTPKENTAHAIKTGLTKPRGKAKNSRPDLSTPPHERYGGAMVFEVVDLETDKLQVIIGMVDLRRLLRTDVNGIRAIFGDKKVNETAIIKNMEVTYKGLVKDVYKKERLATGAQEVANEEK